MEILLSRLTPTPQKPAATVQKKKAYNQDLISVDILNDGAGHRDDLVSDDGAIGSNKE